MGGLVQDVQRQGASAVDQAVEFARAALELLPTWARVSIVVFVLVAAVASKWIIPALAELTRARKGG